MKLPVNDLSPYSDQLYISICIYTVYIHGLKLANYKNVPVMRKSTKYGTDVTVVVAVVVGCVITLLSTQQVTDFEKSVLSIIMRVYCAKQTHVKFPWWTSGLSSEVVF